MLRAFCAHVAVASVLLLAPAAHAQQSAVTLRVIPDPALPAPTPTFPTISAKTDRGATLRAEQKDSVYEIALPPGFRNFVRVMLSWPGRGADPRDGRCDREVRLAPMAVSASEVLDLEIACKYLEITPLNIQKLRSFQPGISGVLTKYLTAKAATLRIWRQGPERLGSRTFEFLRVWFDEAVRLSAPENGRIFIIDYDAELYDVLRTLVGRSKSSDGERKNFVAWFCYDGEEACFESIANYLAAAKTANPALPAVPWSKS